MRPLRFILIVCACVVTTAAMAQSLAGSYRLVQDSTGKQPRDGATIDIVFKPGGTFTLKAAMPGQTVDDTGTYRVSGQTLTIDFKDMEQGHQSGANAVADYANQKARKEWWEGQNDNGWLYAGRTSSRSNP